MTARLLKNVGAVLFSAALVSGVSASAGAAEVETTVTKLPGGVLVVDKAKATVTIKAIDKATRDITLEAADGRTETFQAGPAMVNFDQLAVGDKVNAKHTEAIAVYLSKEAEPSAGAGAGIARAPVGGTPGGAVVGVAQITAKITELNVEERRVTLQMPDDTTRKVNAPEGVDLTKVTVGDTISVVVTKGLEIEVEKP